LFLLQAMEEGTRTKKTVFVGGISDDIDESNIYENFSTFGAIPISTFARCTPNTFLRR
jgi:RNA recognition motif-containing protein